MPDLMKEICGNCGFTFGSHWTNRDDSIKNYCPGGEWDMNWKNGPGTCFKPTGTYKED